MRDIVLITLILAALPVAFARPWLGILLWTWVGMMNPHKLTWSVAYDMPFAQLIAIATLTGLFFTKDRKPIPWNFPLALVVILFCYFTFTTFFAWAPEEAWEQWRKVGKILLMVFVTTKVIYTRDRIHLLLLVIALSLGFYGFKGGIFTLTSGGVNHVEGPHGTFISGNTFLALAMLMALPLLIYLAREETRVWLRRVLYATAALTFISIIFTYSRGALVGMAAVVPLIFLKSRRKIWVVLLLLPIAYYAKDWVPEKLYKRAETIQTYEQDMSAMQRIRAWEVAWNVAKDEPLRGAGFEFESGPANRWFSYADRKYDWLGPVAHAAHSIYFQVLGQHGFVAFALYIILLVSTLFSLQRIKKEGLKNPEFQWVTNYATAVQIGLVGYMAAGAFLSSAYFDLLYVFIAVTALLQRELSAVATQAVEDRSISELTRRRQYAFQRAKQA